MADLTHLQRIRQEMPATTSTIYLNAGTFGPLPACVPQAMQQRLQTEWRDGRLGTAAFENIFKIYDHAKSSVAHLLNAEASEIALTGSTSHGMNIISYGLTWQKGDEVITTNHEHLGALAPLYQLRDRSGVVVRMAELDLRAEQPVQDVISKLISERTRLIALSHVTWTTGAALDIRAVVQLAHAHDIPVLIDGAQSAGAIPIDVKELGIDFYAIPMQKWLCGPDGTGALYARQESLRYVTSSFVGYLSVKHEPGIEWELQDDARRFEVGGMQTTAVAGQGAVLDWLREFVGYEWLFNRIHHLNTYAYQQLKELPGLTMLTPRPGESGILTFQLAGQDDVEVVKRLSEDYTISIRNIPSTHALRISTGFYNTEDEIDTLVEALSQL